MESDALLLEACKLEEMGTQKISVLDQSDYLQLPNVESDSFILDMERFSHSTDKDINTNSRIAKMHRSLSRKGSYRGGDKRLNSNNGGERDISMHASSSPKAGSATPEKSMVVTVGHADNPVSPQVQHQITIMAATATSTESKLKRYSFKRTSSSLAFDPRRILLLFATLSSMGTIVLIYFTLCMSKVGEDENGLNW